MPASHRELAELELVLRRLDVLAADVPVEAPWLAPRAAEWDAITAGAWYDAQGLSVVALGVHRHRAYWSAYMEGAVDAGERAALEVIESVGDVIMPGRRSPCCRNP